MTHLDNAAKLLLAMPLSSGARLGPYEVLELAGAGGMSEVYKARDIRLRRTVALKVLRTRDDGDPAARSRLAREARAIAALNHPHICAIHDVGEWNGQDFLVMEFLEGQTLQERLARGPLTTDEFFTTATQIADALVAAHGAGIVHRDLKPSNIMLTPGGVKLLDFGVARQQPTFSGPGEATATMAATIQGDLVGTVPYMAPEQLEGRAVDARTDIFAFGALLFEMATGRRAFDGGSPAAVIAAILGDARPRIAETSPLPRSVLRIIAGRNPHTRFIVYSRSVFQRSGGEQEWVTQQEARLPVLKGRLHAFIVPGGIEKATFRDPTTGKLLRARVVQVLGLRQ